VGVEPGGTYSDKWAVIILKNTLKDKSFPIFVSSNDYK